MTLPPRDDEPDDHARPGEQTDAPTSPHLEPDPGADPASSSAAEPAAEPAAAAQQVPDPEQAQLDAWEAIVANYGDRPRWEDAGASTPHPDHPAGRGRRPRPSEPDRDDRHELADPDDRDDHGDLARGPEERFVPGPPPPLPRTSPARFLAWFGMLGVPSLVLVGLVAGVRLPSWLSLLLLAWFVGGFGFLVASMRTDRDDPDDGAVV